MAAQYRVFQFEDVDECLTLVPLCARRALDAAGLKVSLAAWQSLPLHARQALARAGSGASVPVGVVEESLIGLEPPPLPVVGEIDPAPDSIPDSVVTALGHERPLSRTLWATLCPLERWVLVKLSQRDDHTRLNMAYDAIIGHSAHSAHLTPSGTVRMINVAEKAITRRTAVAESHIRMNEAAFACLEKGNAPKGDVLGAARLAGIMAAKRTGELIPLCHPLSLSAIDVDCALVRESHSVAVTTQVVASDRTGVEMEALVAATVAALTIYDMLKSIDRSMVIENTRLISKTGGKSGDFAA